MKVPLMGVLGLSVMLALPGYAEEKSPLPTQKEKMSYAIGMDIGKNMKEQGLELDPESFLKGVKTSLAGDKSLLTEDELKTVFETMQKDMMAKREVKATKGKEEGEKFLAANKSKEGVKTTASGL